MKIFKKWSEKVDGTINKAFFRHGRFVAKHPWKIILTFTAINLLLGIGILKIKMIEDPLYLYIPTGNRAKRDQNELSSIYPDFSKTNYYTHSLLNFGKFGEILLTDKNGGNILTEDGLEEIDRLFQYITKEIIYTDINGTQFSYTDLCAKRDESCVIDGEELLEIREKLFNGEVTYPQYLIDLEPIFIPMFLGGVTVRNGRVVEARAIRLRLNLIDDPISLEWELEFKDKMEEFVSEKNILFFAYSNALRIEGNATIERDLVWFAFTITLMIIFATVATMGGNCLSDRSHLGQAGVVATLLGIVGAFGLLIAVDVEFVNIVGISPFLIIGIGLDSMFIMLSGLADAIRYTSIEDRIGQTMRTSGVAITITSLTDILAFCVGISSPFPGVRIFCSYTAVGILFSYVNYMTFFPACMAIHEKRVAVYRHSCTCRRIRSRVELEEGGASQLYAMCCGGSHPKSRKDVDNPIEKLVAAFAEKIFTSEWLRPIVVLLYLLYLGLTVWSTMHFKEGILIKQISYEGSSYFDHIEASMNNYDLELIISLDIMQPINYSDDSVQEQIMALIAEAKKDILIREDFHVSWLDAFMSSDLYNMTSESAFVRNLKVFLNLNRFYRNDVVFDDKMDRINASRVYVRSYGDDDWVSMTALMVRMNDVVDASSLPATTFAPHFIYFSQIVEIVEQTQTILAFAGISIFIVTAILIPQPVMIMLTLFSVASMMVGLIGFMYLWGLTLSSLTMLAMIMSVGFSVDYSVHIIHAYLQAAGKTREEKIRKAIEMAGGPVFNGAFSTFIGICFLLLAKSFLFQTFFIVIFLVLSLGSVHALVLIPVALSVIGPLDITADNASSSLDEIVQEENIEEIPNTDYDHSVEEKTIHKQIFYSGRFELPRIKLENTKQYDQYLSIAYTNLSFSS